MATLDARVDKLEQEQANILYVMGVNHHAILTALGNLDRKFDRLEQDVQGLKTDMQEVLRLLR